SPALTFRPIMLTRRGFAITPVGLVAGERGRGDLAVLLRSPAADAQRADDPAFEDDRHAALDRDHTGQAEDCGPACGDPVGESLARPLEHRGGPRLLLRHD